MLASVIGGPGGCLTHKLPLLLSVVDKSLKSRD
jgi:hypothetical protein